MKQYVRDLIWGIFWQYQLNSLLDLKQKEANVSEALSARKQAESTSRQAEIAANHAEQGARQAELATVQATETVRQGRTVLLFTVVTIIFVRWCDLIFTHQT
jgi:hypothetical protein